MPEKQAPNIVDLLTRLDQLTRAGSDFAERFERDQISDFVLDHCIEELRAIRRQLYALDLLIESLST